MVFGTLFRDGENSASVNPLLGQEEIMLAKKAEKVKWKLKI